VQCWLTSLTVRHQSPIVQVFVNIGSLPWVVVTDPYESQDILLRRTKEFDRSGFFGDVVGGILPEQHISYLSTDPHFKNQRALINHLMAPTFVTTILGPRLYQSASTMIRVWKRKCELANGRPFKAHHDIVYMALDTIFMAMFGHPEEESITTKRLLAMEDFVPPKTENSNLDDVMEFPEPPIADVFAAALTLGDSLTDVQMSPAPRLTSWVLRQFPYMKKAIATKDKYIRDRVLENVALIEEAERTGTREEPRTALYSVLLRERDMAAKEGRPPAYTKRGIADEFFGFMIAGHDTSATTAAWGVKYLADNPRVQDRLRANLRAAFPEAAREGRAPTYAELSSALAHAQLPYLDAVVEEILRHANTIAFVVRRAQCDTTVLGRHIPKGTDVFFAANGAYYLQPGMKVSDDERSPGARSGKPGLTGLWDDADCGEFKPERWLKKDDEGKEVFDPLAGPTLAFGLGQRGCFGKRFALHELKIQFALMIWHFELLKTPADLSGYDAVQRFAREPKQCYVRLKLVE
jgi:cytochrome P450